MDPVPSSTDYEHPHWWENAGGAVGDPWFVQVLDHGVEVARVQLDERGGINSSYPVAPAALGGELLEIQFIEVASASRRRKVATRAVQALAERHPDRQLMAYSRDAEDFWDSLAGWERSITPTARARCSSNDLDSGHRAGPAQYLVPGPFPATYSSGPRRQR